MLAEMGSLVQFHRGFGYGMRGDWFGYLGRGFPFGPVVAGLVLAGLVAAVVVLSIRLARKERRRASEAIEILKARYARGEISKNEFEEMRRDLS